MPDQEIQRKLVSSITDFLSTSIANGTISSDRREDLQAASKCGQFGACRTRLLIHLPVQNIGNTFHVDLADDNHHEQFTAHPASLQTIFEDYLHSREQVTKVL